MKTLSLATAAALVLGAGGAASLVSAPALAQTKIEAVTGAGAGTGGDAPGRQANSPSHQIDAQADADMNSRYGTRFGMAYSDLDTDHSGHVSFDELYGTDTTWTDTDRRSAEAYYTANAADPTSGMSEQELTDLQQRLAGQSGTGGASTGANNSNN